MKDPIGIKMKGLDKPIILDTNQNTVGLTFKELLSAYTERKSSAFKCSIEELDEKFVRGNGCKPNVKNLPQFIFNLNKFKRDEDGLEKAKSYSGSCVVCKGDTKFNLFTGKYCRFCCQNCIDKYKEDFKNRMQNTYGRTYFTQDPEAQKKMMNSRKISQKYTFKGVEYNAVGSYELEFLDFMFKILKCEPEDLIECPFTISYEFNGTERFHIPDFYLPSLKLIVEIKSSKSAYAERDKEFEAHKRKIAEDFAKEKNLHYYCLFDKNYYDFLQYLKKLISQNIEVDK